MPCERRALHSHREFAHAGESVQLAEIDVRRPATPSDYVAEALKQRFSLVLGFALDALCQQRCRGGRDRASGALEGRIGDHAVLELDVEGNPIAAQWIESFRFAIRVGQRAKVPRLPVVVEDDLLVEIAQITHGPLTVQTAPALRAHPRSTRRLRCACCRARTTREPSRARRNDPSPASRSDVPCELRCPGGRESFRSRADEYL